MDSADSGTLGRTKSLRNLHALRWLHAIRGAVSFDTALPEITGGILCAMLVHVSLPMVRASTSESLPSMYGTGQPSNAAGTEPLPGAWVALAGNAVQVALLA